MVLLLPLFLKYVKLAFVIKYFTMRLQALSIELVIDGPELVRKIDKMEEGRSLVMKLEVE